MPLIQVLPNTSAAPAPGWAYVPDTGYDPSKVAINPKDRKRAAARPKGAPSGNELSSRQQTAIQRRIQELERDNDPKLSIPVPGRVAPKTPATKKILLSQKNIKHWLDDEEAELQQAAQSRIQPAPARTSAARIARAGPRRQSIMASAPPTPLQVLTPLRVASEAPTPAAGLSDRTSQTTEDPLLSVANSLPSMPDRDEIEALLAAPPLSYAASHAAPSASGQPQRQFCDNCGYWGKIRCLKCGARVCGLECKDAHEGTRCLKWA